MQILRVCLRTNYQALLEIMNERNATMAAIAMIKNHIQTLKGFRDFLPVDAKQRQWLFGKMKEAAELWGFEPIETPTLEPLELFEGEIGEDEKLFFKFTDQGKRNVALRYDQTVPTCRFIANNFNELTFPFKRYQFQPVFRAEKPQRGRYREFAQFDVDIFGMASPIADAECIALTLATYQAIGFQNPIIAIGSRSLMKDIPYEAIVAIDKLAKIGAEGVIEDMMRKGIDPNQANAYLQQVQNLKPNEELEIIFEYLRSSGFPDNFYKFEPTLARSFSYSDGPIWEIIIPEYSAGSVGGGERYDGMMQRITGQNIPATGIAYGFDRTLEAAIELGIAPQITTTTKALVTVFDYSTLPNSLSVAGKLREAGVKTEVFPDSDTKLPKQLKYADKKQLPFVIMIGSEEVASNLVTVKSMKTGEQQKVSLDSLVEHLKS